ncbi:MAG: YoaK family protein [Chthoniobacteraceae bacterium]
MISKLPRWIWYCGWVLAFIAGMVNVVGIYGVQHQAITHLTGNTSLLAIAIATADPFGILRAAAVIGSFVLGTALSGFIIQDTALQLGRRYGVALALEAVLLAVAAPLLEHHNPGGLYVAAGACGLQNAMVTTYSGTVIRTTHLSGMFTDLGIFLGHALRGLPVDTKRVRMCLLVISGFFFGGIIGVICFRKLGFSTLYIPSLVTAGASLGYALYLARKQRPIGNPI